MLYTLNYSVLEREVYVNYTSIKLKEKLKLKKNRDIILWLRRIKCVLA